VGSLESDLTLAHELADAADEITVQRFRALDLHVESKPDLTPVSDADRDVEQLLRSIVASRRPGDAVLGEEYGDAGTGPRRWVVDPIDGTKNFVRGVPVWATLISLMVEDEVVVGVVSAPALNRRWWAMKGGGAFTGKSLYKSSQCHVSDVSRLEDASLSYSSLDGWEERGRLDDFMALARRCWRTRAYGDFWSYMLVAEGAVDVAAEPSLEIYDMAALDVIVREAGGRFTSLDGRDGPTGGNALASNGILHETVLGFLGSVGPPRGRGDAERADHRNGGGSSPEQRPADPPATGGTLHDLSSRRRPAPPEPELPPLGP
jgi:histidinol-phosphatase